MASIDSLTLELAAVAKELKAVHKLLRKVRQTQEDPTGEIAKQRASRSGFNRLQKVSPALQGFLGLADGEGISRGQVTKRINEYVKTNNLKHPENGRVFILDEKLKDLLKVPEGVDVQFTNLQTYLKPHYVGPMDADDSTSTPDENGASVPSTPAPTTQVVKRIIKKPVVKKSAA